MNLLKYIGGLAILWGFLGRKVSNAASSLITAEILRPRLSDIKLVKGVIELQLRVTNNTPAKVILNGYSGSVKRNNKTIATAQLSGPIELPGGAQTVIIVPVKVKFALLQEIYNSILTGGVLAPIEIDSILRTTVGNIPVKTQVKFLTTTFG